MDTYERVGLLSQAAEWEAADTFGDAAPSGRDLSACVTNVAAPGGRAVPVLKVLQSNACRNNCYYCAFRAGRDYRRLHLAPDELARSVDLMQRAGIVEGIFLSSGITDTTKTMDEMLATAELLRGKYAFRGYLHLKLLPGVEAAQVERAVQLADRVSTNLEGPTSGRLQALAPQKRLEELVGPLRAAAGVIRQARPESRSLCAPANLTGVGNAWLGTSTQFVVGPAGESDRELLATAASLYREIHLTRAYYSPFRPVPRTPLEDAPPTDRRRQQRLYQADWLLRYYHFGLEELAFEAGGQLNAAVDPKVGWARLHPERFPVEVNRAGLEELLRVPGIGPASARAILRARRLGTLRSLGDLRRLGARADHAAPYVVLAGKRPPWQMPLPYES